MKRYESSVTVTTQVDLLGRPAPDARCRFGFEECDRCGKKLEEGCRGHQEPHDCWMADTIVLNKEYGAFQGKCGSHTCNVDGQLVRNKLSWAVADNAVQLKLCYFWTLTLADSGWIACPNCESHAVSQVAWNRFATAVRKKFPWFKFIVFREFTEAGVEHQHFLTNVYLDEAWVKDEWARASGGSYVAWVEWITDKKAAADYVASYLTLISKITGRKGLYPKRARRYSTSRTIHLLHHDDRTWELYSKTIVRKKLQERGVYNLEGWFLDLIDRGAINMFDVKGDVPHLVGELVDQDQEIDNGHNHFSATEWLNSARQRFVIA